MFIVHERDRERDRNDEIKEEYESKKAVHAMWKVPVVMAVNHKARDIKISIMIVISMDSCESEIILTITYYNNKLVGRVTKRPPYMFLIK